MTNGHQVPFFGFSQWFGHSSLSASPSHPFATRLRASGRLVLPRLSWVYSRSWLPGCGFDLVWRASAAQLRVSLAGGRLARHWKIVIEMPWRTHVARTFACAMQIVGTY